MEDFSQGIATPESDALHLLAPIDFGHLDAPITRNPGTLEVLRDAFRLENEVGSFLNREQDAPFFWQKPNEFDPFQHIPEAKREQAGRYWNANSLEQVNAITRQIDGENEAKQTVQEAGLLGTGAMITAGLLSPINLIPIGGTAYRTYRGGGSILKNALLTMAEAGGAITASETLLHGSQVTRSYGESALSVGTGALLGGLIGGAAPVVQKFFTKKNVAGRIFTSLDEWEGGLEKEFEIPAMDQDDIFDGVKVPRETLERDTKGMMQARSETEALLEGNGWLDKFPGLRNEITGNPLMRTALSPSVETRRTTQLLGENPLRYEDNALGLTAGAPAEAIAKQDLPRVLYALKDIDDLFIQYRTGKAAKPGVKLALEMEDLARRTPDGVFTYQQFREEVGKAMFSGDKHLVPEVTQAARKMRPVFDRLKERAIRQGLLPEGIEAQTAPSYLMRLYNIPKILKRSHEFDEINFEWLKLKEMQKPIEMQRTDGELLRAAQQIRHKITGSPDGRLPYDLQFEDLADDFRPQARKASDKSKPLKKRAYDIPEDFNTYSGLRFSDFLDTDIEYVAKVYNRTLSADLALHETFGSVDLADRIRAISLDWEKKIAAATSEAERAKLHKLKERDINDIEAMVLRFRGLYKLPENPDAMLPTIGRMLKKYNNVRVMGSVVLSSIPDIARPMMVMGMKTYLAHGLRPLITNFKAFRMAAEEVKLAGTALDMLGGGRFLNLAETLDDYGRHSRMERMLTGISEGFGKVSGIAPWNSFMKQFSGVMVQSRIMNAVLDLEKGVIKPGDLKRLAASYIDDEMATRIAKQFKKHGGYEDGAALLNTNAWTDVGAVETIRAAIAADVDRIIVTPGMDKPLWLSTQMGSVMGQFKSFFLASTQRVLLSGLQDRDLATLNGLVFMVSLGVLSSILHAKVAGRTLSQDPEDLILEGIDRSGVTGWLMDGNHMLEAATGGGLGLSRLRGREPLSRYASRNLLDAVIGPSGGIVEDVGKVGRATTTGDVRKSDIRAMRRLLPYQNLFYLRHLFNEGEAGVAGNLGVSE